jgi:hypothetical protein
VGANAELNAGETRRQIQRDLAQILDRQSEIDTRAFKRAMPQQVADRFQRDPRSEKVHRVRMSKAMGALERNRQPAARRPGLEGLRHGRRFEHPDRRPVSKKQLPKGRRRPPSKRHSLSAEGQSRSPVTEIVQQRGPHSVGERQPERPAGLPLRDAQTRRPPLHIVERQRDDLARTQAVGCDEQKHRVIALAHRCRAIDGLEQRLHGVPGKRSRQLLTAIHARRVDLRVQTRRDLTFGGEESEKRPDVRDDVLERRASLSWTNRAEKRLEIAAGERGEPCRPSLVPQVRQKLGNRPAMVRASRRGESTDLLEVRRVGRDALSDAR